MISVGIDPGWNGGVAVVDGRRLLLTMAFPAKGAYGFLLEDIMRLREFSPDIVVVEDVGSRPTDSAQAAFTFGCNLGAVETALSQLRGQVEFLHLSADIRLWQTELGVYGLKLSDPKTGEELKPTGKTRQRYKTVKKNYHKTVASGIFNVPEPQITHAVADAMLLAEYGTRFYEST